MKKEIRFYGPLIKTDKIPYKFGFGFSVTNTKYIWRKEIKLTVGFLFWLTELTLTLDTDKELGEQSNGKERT